MSVVYFVPLQLSLSSHELGWCSPRSYELDVLALWVSYLVGKPMLASCLSSTFIFHSTINVGYTRPGLVRYRALEYWHQGPLLAFKARLVWMHGPEVATCSRPVGLVRWLLACDFTCPLRHVLAFSRLFAFLICVCLASIFHRCKLSFWKRSKERKGFPSILLQLSDNSLSSFWFRRLFLDLHDVSCFLS